MRRVDGSCSMYSGSQWIRGKSFDTFAPLGPFLLLASSYASRLAHEQALSSFRITTTLNDTVMQDGYTRNMLFDVAKLIAFASQGTTLKRGTVIMTGTQEHATSMWNVKLSCVPVSYVQVCHVMFACHVCDVMPRCDDVMSCHVVSCRVMSFYVVS